MDMDVLKEKYKELVKKFEQQTDLASASLQIPKLVSPFQFLYNDLYKEYAQLQEELDELLYNETMGTKMQNTELSFVNLNASELKRMVEASPKYRTLKLRQETVYADMKLVEDMVNTIKSFSFNIGNAIKYKEFMYSGKNT